MHLRILLFQSKLSQLRRWHGKRPDHNAHDRHSHTHHLEALLRSKFRTKDALSRSAPSTRRFGLRVEVALSEDELKRAGRFLQGQPSDAEALHAVDPSLASCGLRKGHVTELVIEDELKSLCYQRVGSENWIREGASVPTRW